MTPLEAIKLVESQSLKGMKKAVRFNNDLFVSPAMYELLSKEKGEDLQRLLANIPIIDMGQFNVMSCMDEITTQPMVSNDVPLWKTLDPRD